MAGVGRAGVESYPAGVWGYAGRKQAGERHLPSFPKLGLGGKEGLRGGGCGFAARGGRGRQEDGQEGNGASHWHGCAKPHKRGVRCDSIEGGKNFPHSTASGNWELGVGKAGAGIGEAEGAGNPNSQLPTPNVVIYIHY